MYFKQPIILEMLISIFSYSDSWAWSTGPGFRKAGDVERLNCLETRSLSTGHHVPHRLSVIHVLSLD